MCGFQGRQIFVKIMKRICVKHHASRWSNGFFKINFSVSLYIYLLLTKEFKVFFTVRKRSCGKVRNLRCFLLSANEVAERYCFHKCVSRILSTGGGVHPLRQTPPPPPPRDGHWSGGRYASCWNAFLLHW